MNALSKFSIKSTACLRRSEIPDLAQHHSGQNSRRIRNGRNGPDRLQDMIDHRLGRERKILYIDIPVSDGKAASWLYRRSEVLERNDTEEFCRLTVSIEPVDTSSLSKDQF